MNGDIGYKFCWLLPSGDQNQGTPAGKTRIRYSPRFHHFLVLARTLLRYLPGPLSGTHLDSTISRYSPEPFFDTRPDSTISRYSPGPFFDARQDFPIFFSTYPNPSLVLARILLFSGTCPNRIPNLSWHRDRASLHLSLASCLYPIVHSISMTYFPLPSLLLGGDKIVGHLGFFTRVHFTLALLALRTHNSLVHSL